MDLVGNITGFQHLGIPVTDLDDSVRFYESLGFRTDIKSNLEENGETTRIAFMNLGSFCIELYQPAGDFEFASKPGPIDHITLDVRDIDIAYEQFKRSGYSILEGSPVHLPIHRGGVKYFNVIGPSGEKVEFNQLLYYVQQ